LPAVPRPRSVLLAFVLMLGLLAPPGAAHAVANPTVGITAPATATGVVPVTTTGEVDLGDTAQSMRLYVDGQAYGAAIACAGPITDPTGCPTTFFWDSSELNGQHTLQALLFTTDFPLGAPSTLLTVTATNPLPSVAVSQPTANQVVKGTLTIDAVGSVDASQSDRPLSMQVLVDGVKHGEPQPCVLATAKTCTETFTIPTTGQSGTHTVQVSMATSLTTAVSPIVPYTVFATLRATLAKVKPQRAGRSVVLHGQVVAVDGGAGVGGVKVKITLSPAAGKKRALTVRTGASGKYSLTTKLTANTAVVASVSATHVSSATHASTRISAFAPIACKVSPTLVHRRFDAGQCTVPLLPDGTKVSLQYQSHKKWHVLAAGTTQGTSIPVSFTFPARGKFPVRLVLGANKVYVATSGVPFTVTVT
jgi:hypothetical protein